MHNKTVLRTRAVAVVVGMSLALGVGAASYRVYELPVASPDHGARVLLTDPADVAASPFGWHDVDGIDGAEFTTLRGNNVWVYVDADNNSLPDDAGPDGGLGLVFDYAAAPGSVPPSSYSDALATNAFYLGNRFHDILWHHGFGPAEGNFQTNTYGLGGLGNDAVKIEIRKGGGLNNAGWAAAADGTAPTLRFYEWNMTNPNREVSFAADVAAFTYMQITQSRLTGGSCLSNADRAEIGVSDFFGVLVTNDFAATTSATPRGPATWLMGQPVSGTGIRAHPYSSDMGTNPLTYANSATATSPHGIGVIYASALWDLAWLMVQRDGASGDLVNGDGGDNRVLRLVIEGLKAQPCNSGLLDSRDALLQANLSLYGGTYACDIWQAFARRGMGVSANQGSVTSLADNVAAFDVPAPCSEFIFADGFEGPPPEPVWQQFCPVAGTIDLPAGQPATTSGPASVYPIEVPVSGLATDVVGVRVQMFGLTHTFPNDLDFLLIAPDGRSLVFQSDAGAGVDLSNATYTIDDAAASLMPIDAQLISASYRPTDFFDGDPFAAPAPVGPYQRAATAGTATFASAFGGVDGNGSWEIYIVDDASGDFGQIDGVCLEIGVLP